MLVTMPNFVTFERLLISTLTVALTVVYFLYSKQRQKSRELAATLPKVSLQKAEEKSHSLIHRAIKKAQTILGRAELEGIKVVADNRVLMRELEEEQKQQMTKIAATLEGEFQNYLQTLQQKSDQAQRESEILAQQKTNAIFERFEKNLASFLTATEQKSVTAIEVELKNTRQLINSYKTQQLAMIDENIIAMLEKTLSLVLTKKISLKDELDLVYEALERAKVENFIV